MAASETEVDCSLAKVLQALSYCVELFLKARDAGRIQFDPGQLTMAAAEIGRILEVAATNPDIARQLILYAPARCQKQINAIQRRDGLLRVDEISNHFAAWCDCTDPEMLRSPPRIEDPPIATDNAWRYPEKEGQGS